MLWDGKSKGTLQNMLKLIVAEKRALVYSAPTKDFHAVGSEDDLQALLARCRKSEFDGGSRVGIESAALANALTLSTGKSKTESPGALS